MKYLNTEDNGFILNTSKGSNILRNRAITNFKTIPIKEKEIIEEEDNYKKIKKLKINTKMPKLKAAINNNSFNKRINSPNSKTFIGTPRNNNDRYNINLKNNNYQKNLDKTYTNANTNNLQVKNDKLKKNKKAGNYKKKEDDKLNILDGVNKKIKKNKDIGNKDSNQKTENREDNMISTGTEIDLKNSKSTGINDIHNRMQKLSVENIVKLVDDVNQNINKLLVGNQILLQKNNSGKREGCKSFILNKGNDINKIFHKITEDNIIIENENDENINENSNIKKRNSKLKYQKSYNGLSNRKGNESSNQKNNNKNKINNENNNNNNNPDKKGKEIEITNFIISKSQKKRIKNSSNSISNKNKSANNEKNIVNNLQNTTRIAKEKIEKDLNLISFKNEKVNNTSDTIKNLNIINLLVNNPKILEKILGYLSFYNKIKFLSISKSFINEKISLLYNKKD